MREIQNSNRTNTCIKHPNNNVEKFRLCCGTVCQCVVSTAVLIAQQHSSAQLVHSSPQRSCCHLVLLTKSNNNDNAICTEYHGSKGLRQSKTS